jgi:hypothetical protein
VSTTSPMAATRPTSLDALGQVRRLGALLSRWVQHQTSAFFDLSVAGARRRNIQLAVVLALAGMGAIAIGSWLALKQPFLASNAPGGSTVPTLVLVQILRVALITGIAAAVALRAAGHFLAEIFELRDVDTAWRFLRRAASGSTSETLRLREGQIAESDQDSSILLIGGPGRVQVDTDTAALFERGDGTPHVVVPRLTSPADPGDSRSAELLGAFERLREPVVDLRDQYIGTSAGESIMVVGRSLDGMPVSVVDVHGVFSVRRDPNASTGVDSRHASYAVRPQDIENLIYRQTVPVQTSEEYASGPPPDWTEEMRSLIREALRDFMSQNRLGDYLSGTGAHEVELSEYREDTILARSLQVASDLPGITSGNSQPASGLRPRTDLSARFKKYGSEFSTRAQQLGLELHWIGVGTWKIPEVSKGAIIDAKHLEAWRMNRENAERSSSGALEAVTAGALLDGKIRLLQEVPISSHQKNQQRYSDKYVLLECLLQDFWGQMGDALDIYYRNDTHSLVVDALEQAVLEVEDLLGLQQVGSLLGPGFTSRVRPRPQSATQEQAPPAPTSRSEAAKYQVLLGKLDGSYRVAEAMITSEARRHADLSREQLITRILQRFERHGR